MVAAYSIVDLPNYYISGFNITVASNTTLTVGNGVCRDSTNSVDITLGVNNPNANQQTVAAPLTVNFAVNGANGLDTGTFAASTVYAIYMIADSRGYNSTAAIATLSSNANPLLPNGYDCWRLIGFAVSDGSTHLLSAYLTGQGNFRFFQFDAPQATAVTSGASTSFAAVNLIHLVPNINNLMVQFYYSFTPAAAGHILYLQPGNGTGNTVTINGQVASVAISNNTQVLAQPTTISTVLSPTINYKVDNSSDSAAFYVSGFWFSL